jgi:hypothetical protein
LAGPLPRDRHAALADEIHSASLRTTVMLLALEKIQPALEVAGCRPLVLKGGALALDVYPVPEQRWFLDLDLLVPPPQRDTALATLAEMGYRGDERRHDPRYYDAHHFHRILSNPQGVVVELHWAVTLARSMYRYDLEAMRSGAATVALGKTTARIPTSVDLILLTALQNVAGGFEDLRRVLDAALLERRLSAADREVLVARARASNLATALWLQYRLLGEITGLQAPATVMNELQPNAAIRRCLDRVPVARLCVNGHRGAPTAYPYLLHCLCAPTVRLRIREMTRYVVLGPDLLQEAAVLRGESPSFVRRVILTLQRLKAAGLAAGYLFWRLLGGR